MLITIFCVDYPQNVVSSTDNDGRSDYRIDEDELSRLTYQPMCDGCIVGQNPRGSSAQ